MSVDSRPSPILRWDPVRLVLALDEVERLLADRLGRDGSVCELRLSGGGDRVVVTATVRWGGLASRACAELTELRLRRRHLGLRVDRVAVLGGGVRVPRSVVLKRLDGAMEGAVAVFSDDGIVVVDLRRWLPPELELSVIAVQVVGRTLELWLGRGALDALPGQPRAALPAGAGPA